MYTYVGPKGRYACAFSDAPSIIDLERRRVVARLEGLTRYAVAVFDRRGKRVMATDDGGALAVWDVETGKRKLSFSEENGITAYAFDPGDRWIAVGTASRQVVFLDARTASEVRRVQLPQAGPAPAAMAFDRRGRRLIVVAGGSMVYVVSDGRR